ncbi:MAG: hypothetical protein ACRCWR_11145 [Saezia sp.]
MLKKSIVFMLGMLLCLHSHAQQNTHYAMQQQLTHKEISQLLGTPSVFQLSAQEDALLIYAADQGFSPAAHEMGVIYKARELYDKALHYYQIAVMNGNDSGRKAAYALQTFWYDNEAFDEAFGDLRSKTAP